MKKKAKIIEISSGQHPPPEKESGTIGVGVGETIGPADVIRLAHHGKLSHVVQKNGLAYETELKVAQIMNEELSAFLTDPIATIFGTSSDVPLSRSTLHLMNPVWEKKSRSLDLLETFLGAVKGARRIRERALLVADELYTNAKKVGTPHKLIAPGAKARAGTVEFFASADETRLVLGCRDSFGELSYQNVLARLEQCFEVGLARSIKQGNSGAGIGSFLVFDTCTSYYCGVQKGFATVVCVAIPLGVTDEELSALPKNIHLVAA